MSTPLKHHKTVAALPATLEPDSVYYVRAGAGFDVYVTTSTGVVIAHQLNKVNLISGGSTDGLAATSWSVGCTVTWTAAGQWTVTFDNANPNGVNYGVGLSTEQSAGFRDPTFISIVAGTKTGNGFDVQLVTDDHGTTPDVYVDTPWSFNVMGVGI